MVELPPLSNEQRQLIDLPVSGSLFLEGAAGTGKTTTALYRYGQMLNDGIPPDNILLLAPQRTLLQPYLTLYQDVGLPSGTTPTAVTLGGLARRLIALFWPLISEQAGFKNPHIPPVFLTLETSQYYMSRIVRPLIDKGYFNTITIDRNRLYSQVVDNLNKAAGAGFSYTQIGERLKSAWVGEPTQHHVYEEAQECASLFRAFCLENNLLDFSLQVEIFAHQLWPSVLCQRYLFQSYPHLIYENLEEDIPVFQDIIRNWLPNFKSAWLIFDSDGGFRTFLGADKENGATLGEECQYQAALTESWIPSLPVAKFREALTNAFRAIPGKSPDQHLANAIRIASCNFYPEMVEIVCQQIASLIETQQVTPEQIVILAPYISDSLRFTVMNRLEQLGIHAQSHRPSRSLKDEPATDCLLTLAKLAHPHWNLACSQAEIRQALMTAIQDLDLVRADLLAKICFKPNRWEEGLSSFDKIQPDMQARIGYWVGERFENLRNWLDEYRQEIPLDLDIFLGKVFGEILSQPGYGFHSNFDASAVTARLIESIQKFRLVVGKTIPTESGSIGKEYILMVADGVVAAQYIQSWETTDNGAVLVAPAYTYLMSNRITHYQFWLDIGSPGWWERLYQPLTHPVVLSRHWNPGAIWSDLDEQNHNLESLVRLTGGLLSRCTKAVYLCTSRVNQQGDETRGRLLLAVQSILRRLPDRSEVLIV